MAASAEPPPQTPQLARQIKRATVPGSIRQCASLSRTGLARITALAPATCCAIGEEPVPMNPLLDDGIGRSRGGRCPILFRLQPWTFFVIGVDTGGLATMVAVLTDLGGQVLVRTAWELQTAELPNREELLMDPLETYYSQVLAALERIRLQETEKIHQAGRLIGESLARGRVLHVFGTGGHSYIAGEEVFYRAGGLVPVNAILEPGVSLAFGAVRSTLVERTPGWVKGVLDTYGLRSGDVILVVNANGINSATIDAAQEAKQRGLTVIGVTSPDCSRAIPPGHPARHPSNRNLYEVADLYIDDQVPVGEALVAIEGCDQKVAPASTITNAFILHSIVIAAVEHMVRLGVKPPVWKSANAPGGDEANKRYIAEYAGRIKHL